MADAQGAGIGPEAIHAVQRRRLELGRARIDALHQEHIVGLTAKPSDIDGHAVGPRHRLVDRPRHQRGLSQHGARLGRMQQPQVGSGTGSGTKSACSLSIGDNVACRIPVRPRSLTGPLTR